MSLQDGVNDFGDSIVLQMNLHNVQISEWEHISFHNSFLLPTAEVTFSIADQVVQRNEYLSQNLLPGGEVSLSINNHLQFTGFIIQRKLSYSREQGRMINITCRDILNPVIRNNINPQIKFKPNMTLLDMLATVLVPFGITKIYNDGSLNVNIMTGKVQKPSSAAQQVSVLIPTETVGNNNTISTSTTTIGITNNVNGNNIDPSGIKLNQLKPHHKEGAYAFCDRMLKRFGLRMWAAADGSGVIVSTPDFTSTPTHTIIHNSASSNSQVEHAELITDWDIQPSLVIGEGVGGLAPNGASTPMVVVMVNELTGTDIATGQISQPVKDIIAQYPGCTVLPLRSQLLSAANNFAGELVIQPMYEKDDESKTIAQLTSAVKRKMALYQNKAFHLKYTMSGLSLQGIPFAVNSNIIVNDDILNTPTPLWVLETHYERSRMGGSHVDVTMCLPYTLDLTSEEG